MHLTSFGLVVTMLICAVLSLCLSACFCHWTSVWSTQRFSSH